MKINPSIKNALDAANFPRAVLKIEDTIWISRERIIGVEDEVMGSDLIVLNGSNTHEKDLFAGLLCYYTGMKFFHYLSTEIPQVPRETGCIYLSFFDHTHEYKTKQSAQSLCRKVINNGGKVIIGIDSIVSLVDVHKESFLKSFMPKIVQIDCPSADASWQKVRLV